ncbi:hypothetical protein WICANDRAFT_78336 [Wickerhamomyces anomalus NRRL Y-366-8]|uniref:Uncharacterized protein n=1 Tax=Wickerhamomyces anomalus (strain ATCC 58044 / CBS 1984 / NCYC 433 / NRRL Y-366-8) TaxID=683960 RepID=A0A1E3P307_WICAA|nr:uncharacterized protein WICANDRAFT_78336 [Wickerhamomyces anomalus NRRL Y-366-8]ODQ59698.1 hypothetical protein WICANDRAFT_78336 [Wickerhamomyces anomalus NRRL Y-366-8]
MSGIFDKYLNMINGSKHTHGQMNTKINAGTQRHSYVNGHDKYVPYERRKSSVSSIGSDAEGASRNSSVSSQQGITESMNPSNNPFQNPGVVTDAQVKKVLSEPNNRVNF